MIFIFPANPPSYFRGFPTKRKRSKWDHGPWIAHLSSCHKERMLTTKYKSHFFKTQVHLRYHSDHKKDTNSLSSIKILICTISMSDVFTQPKRSGVCIRSNLHNVPHFFPFNLICNITFFRKKCSYPLTLSGVVGV